MKAIVPYNLGTRKCICLGGHTEVTTTRELAFSASRRLRGEVLLFPIPAIPTSAPCLCVGPSHFLLDTAYTCRYIRLHW